MKNFMNGALAGLFFTLILCLFIFAVFAHIQDPEITKCEANLPRSERCVLQAVPEKK